VKISFSDSALSDLENILRHYDEQLAPEAGQDQVNKIISRVETLIDHPNIGRTVPEFGDPNIRELIQAPFRIVYINEQAVIHIVRVWRSERLLALPEDKK